ncbi:MAG: DUF899 domain-containing protein [Thermomicrobiales bacterium]
MNNAVVTRQEWIEARKELLQREKEVTKLRDKMLTERHALPWVKIDKDYVFESESGPVSLADLFDGRSQLIVYHFMFGPDWEEGCPGCSFLSDHVGGTLAHLENHDVTFVSVARAPLAKIQAYHARMGWPFRWVSSFGSDFNFDFGVSFTPEQIANGTGRYNFSEEAVGSDELPGASAFYKDEKGDIYHTYSEFGRGGEEEITTYMYLDIAPLGRNEADGMGDWMRRRDTYEHQPKDYTPQHANVPVVSGGSGCGCGCGS